MRNSILKKAGMAIAGLVGGSFAVPAFAQEAAETAAPVVDKGDTAFIMVCTILVLMMIVPGLALFYGGLVRTKNMLSVLTQTLSVAAVAMIMWVCVGYSFAFTDGSAFFGSADKLFLAGVSKETLADTFSDGFKIPEYVFISFQMTFAAITAALIIGGLAERMKFSAMLMFTVIWSLIVYYPIAHMVWWGGGLLFEMGALDFAGGTVVHINAGVSALVGALLVGKRIGYQKDVMAPHSLTMTLVGAGLLWVGWFGFNAGSALEANGDAALAMINTFVATAAAILAWMVAEKVAGHKPSLLGAASGAISGLVAITPAAGNSGPMGAIILGALASVICFWFVTVLKPKIGLDDSLDAFGIHGIGGIIGSIGTGIVYSASLGGPGGADYDMSSGLWVQTVATLIAITWAAVGSTIAFTIVKYTVGLRVSEDVEREGLDLGEHGERAYNY